MYHPWTRQNPSVHQTNTPTRLRAAGASGFHARRHGAGLISLCFVTASGTICKYCLPLQLFGHRLHCSGRLPLSRLRRLGSRLRRPCFAFSPLGVRRSGLWRPGSRRSTSTRNKLFQCLCRCIFHKLKDHKSVKNRRRQVPTPCPPLNPLSWNSARRNSNAGGRLRLNMTHCQQSMNDLSVV